jgi:hypothetical protein
MPSAKEVPVLCMSPTLSAIGPFCCRFVPCCLSCPQSWFIPPFFFICLLAQASSFLAHYSALPYPATRSIRWQDWVDGAWSVL